MVAPRAIAKLNRYTTNQVLGRIAPYAPGFGVIEHTGRKSGRKYRTPVNVFGIDGGLLVALTYGRESDWVRNVLAAGGCAVVTRGRTVQLTEPRLVHGPQYKAGLPAPVRTILGVIGVDDFLELRFTTSAPP